MADAVCKNCKWFEPSDEPFLEHRGFDGYCKLTATSDIFPEHPDTKAASFDPSCVWGSSLMVKEDFGCNQFEGQTKNE